MNVTSERISFGGKPVRGFALGQRVGVGDVGDLFSYRDEWQPFIAAHLELWRHVNELLEGVDEAKQCPAGIFTVDKISNLSPVLKSFCASLSLSRMMVSTTDARGILPRWNAWAGKSAAEILAGASSMLAWLQDVVVNVGGPDKTRLVEIANTWKIAIELPDVPTFSAQRDIIARIEGLYTSTKGVLQILGYGAGEIIQQAGDVEQAVAQGLKDTAKELPKTLSWATVVLVATAVVVGGALIVYYVPRRQPDPAPVRRIPATY